MWCPTQLYWRTQVLSYFMQRDKVAHSWWPLVRCCHPFLSVGWHWSHTSRHCRHTWGVRFGGKSAVGALHPGRQTREKVCSQQREKVPPSRGLVWLPTGPSQWRGREVWARGGKEGEAAGSWGGTDSHTIRQSRTGLYSTGNGREVGAHTCRCTKVCGWDLLMPHAMDLPRMEDTSLPQSDSQSSGIAWRPCYRVLAKGVIMTANPPSRSNAQVGFVPACLVSEVKKKSIQIYKSV